MYKTSHRKVYGFLYRGLTLLKLEHIEIANLTTQYGMYNTSEWCAYNSSWTIIATALYNRCVGKRRINTDYFLSYVKVEYW